MGMQKLKRKLYSLFYLIKLKLCLLNRMMMSKAVLFWLLNQIW